MQLRTGMVKSTEGNATNSVTTREVRELMVERAPRKVTLTVVRGTGLLDLATFR
jgi:hypothetical protein